MAKKKIVQKVKTPAGYDIINPLTPWQVQHCSFAPTSTASLYKISTVTPPENLGNECVALFRPTVTNSANIQVEVNGVNFGPIQWNGADLPVGSIPANQYVLLYVDFVSETTQLQDSSGLLKEHINNAAAHIIPATIVYTANSFNVAAAIPPSQTRATLLGYTTQPYTEGDIVTINGVAVTLTDLTGEPLSDGAWGNDSGLAVPVQLMIDLSGATKRAFFKTGGLDAKWNIFTGTVPPDKPDGLFVQTGITLKQVEFTQFATQAGSWDYNFSVMPISMSIGVCGVVGTVCYLIRDNYGYAYDTITDLYSAIPTMPTSRIQFMGCAVGAVVYVVGGSIGSSQTGKHEAYDTISGLWTERAVIPSSRDLAGACANNGIYYVAGGRYNTTVVGTSYAYDTISNIWSQTGTFTARQQPALSASGAKIYLTAGLTNAGAQATQYATDLHQAYDTVTGLVSTLAKIPTSRAAPGVGVVGAIIYCGGGYDYQTILRDHRAYDTVSGLWSTVEPLVATTRQMLYGTVGTDIHYFGGSGNTGSGTRHMAYKVSGDPYPADTLVVEYGYTNKLARLQQGKLVDLVLAIKNAYIHDGTKLSLAPSKVNLDGQGWQDVI